MNEQNRDSLSLLRVQGPVSGLAVDWIHHLLYWTSTGSGSLHIGLLDGSAQRALVTGLQKPSAVAVDPLHRWNIALMGDLNLQKRQRFNVDLLPSDFSGSYSGLSVVTPQRLSDLVWMVGTGRLWSRTSSASPSLFPWVGSQVSHSCTLQKEEALLGCCPPLFSSLVGQYEELYMNKKTFTGFTVYQ